MEKAKETWALIPSESGRTLTHCCFYLWINDQVWQQFNPPPLPPTLTLQCSCCASAPTTAHSSLQSFPFSPTFLFWGCCSFLLNNWKLKERNCNESFSPAAGGEDELMSCGAFESLFCIATYLKHPNSIILYLNALFSFDPEEFESGIRRLLLYLRHNASSFITHITEHSGLHVAALRLIYMSHFAFISTTRPWPTLSPSTATTTLFF